MNDSITASLMLLEKKLVLMHFYLIYQDPLELMVFLVELDQLDRLVDLVDLDLLVPVVYLAAQDFQVRICLITLD